MKRHIILMVITGIALITVACSRDAEQILPSRKGTWDILKVQTSILDAAGSVDSTRTELDLGVITFSEGGLGSVRNNLNNEVNPLVWDAYQGPASDYYVELSYSDASGDSLYYLFTVTESSSKKQEWYTRRVNPKTSKNEDITWFLERAK